MLKAQPLLRRKKFRVSSLIGRLPLIRTSSSLPSEDWLTAGKALRGYILRFM